MFFQRSDQVNGVGCDVLKDQWCGQRDAPFSLWVILQLSGEKREERKEKELNTKLTALIKEYMSNAF